MFRLQRTSINTEEIIKMLNLIILILFCHAPDTKCMEPFPKNSLNSHQLYFHGISPSFDAVYGKNILMVFGGFYDTDIGANYSYRHHQPFHIIYTFFTTKYTTTLNFNTKHLFGIFFHLSFHSKTIFIIVHDFELNIVDYVMEMDEYFRSTPATKVFLNRSQGMAIEAKYLCNGFCGKNGVLRDVSKYTLGIGLDKPAMLHRRLFYNGQGAVVLVKDAATAWLTGTKRCKNGIFQAAECGSVMEATLLVLNVHNLTGMELTLKIDKYKSHSHIYPTRNTEDFEAATSKTAQITYGLFYLSNFYHKLVYFQISKRDFGSDNGPIWTSGISLVFVALLICTLLMTCVLICKKALHPLSIRMLLDGIGIFLGCGVSLPFKIQSYFVVLSWFGFVIIPFYTNEITSLLVVQIPKPPFENLGHMLSAGIKIFYPSSILMPPLQWEKRFGEFRKRNLSHLFNDSISTDPSNKFSQLTAILLETQQLNIAPAVYERLLHARNLKCFILADRFTEHKKYFAAYTPNRLWMLETYSRYFESGIGLKADEWSDLSLLYHYKATGYKPSLKGELKLGVYIDFQSFLPPFFLLIFILGLSLFGLLSEIFQTPLRNIKVLSEMLLSRFKNVIFVIRNKPRSVIKINVKSLH